MKNERIQAKIVKNMEISIVTEMPEEEYTVVLDAIFGVGLNREVSGRYREILEQLNKREW